MKKHLKNIVLAIGFSSLILLPSCNDFSEMNENPTKSDKTDPNTQLTYVELLTFGDFEGLETNTIYISGMMQYLQGEWNVTNYGGQYRRSNTQLEKIWNRTYGYSLKNIVDIISTTADKPEYSNVRSLARIFKVYYSMWLTDMYGDVPYFDAGQGYIVGSVKPKYDKQELIYTDILKELKEAGDALNTNGGTITGDVIYKGDIIKWKKFANSLRLRAAMRLVKVNPELVKAQVADILASSAGVFASSADDAVIIYEDYFDWDVNEFRRNAVAQFWRGRAAYPEQFICSTFWNMLKTKNDPRLFVYGRCYDESSPNNPFNRVDLTNEILTDASIDVIQPSLPGFFWWDNWPNGYYSNLTQKRQDKACRPQVSNIFLRGNSPGILMSYGETEFLLAEANVRWGASIGDATSASQHYTNGLAAAMNIFNYYDKNTSIDSNAISTYLANNPFPSVSQDQLKAINEQLWILLFNNSSEGFSNWRRSGYPELKPAAQYGAVTIDSQTIPRRLTYPINESTINSEAYHEAVQALGGTDSWNARVWWDKN